MTAAELVIAPEPEDDFAAPGAAPPRRDPEDENYYTRPDPEQPDKMRRFPRVTKFVKHGGDTYALDRWHTVYTGIGVARSDDLQVALANLDPETDRNKAAELCKQAQDRLAARSGAIKGTALHMVTEHHDAGQPVYGKGWVHRDLAARNAVLHVLGLVPNPALNERTLCIKRDAEGRTVGEHGLVGTVDSIMVNRATGEQEVVDLKTGRSLKYAIGETKGQLACYSRAGWQWVPVLDHPQGGYWIPAPVVSQRRGWVIALRPGSGQATAIAVDLSDDPDIPGGWAMALMAERRRKAMNAHRRRDVPGWIPVVTATADGEIDQHVERPDMLELTDGTML